jgi:hypothetical protein
LTDIGLQLSYAATAGVIMGARELSAWICRRPEILVQKIADIVALAMVAQLSVLPIQVFYFWSAGCLFIAANVLVLPVVTPVTILGFVSSIVTTVGCLLPVFEPIIQQFCLFPVTTAARLLLTYMLAVVHLLDSITIARIRIGQPSIIVITIYYACLLIFFMSLRVYAKRRLASFLLLLGIFMLGYRAPAPELSLAIFGNSSILMNARRDAVFVHFNAEHSGNNESTKIPIRTTLLQDSIDKNVERFLDFNAVCNLSDTKSDLTEEKSKGDERTALPLQLKWLFERIGMPFQGEPVNCSPGWQEWIEKFFGPTIEAESLDSDVVVCTDSVGCGKIVFLNGFAGLEQAQDKSNMLLGLLQKSSARVLVVRLESNLDSRALHKSFGFERFVRKMCYLTETCAFDKILIVNRNYDGEELLSLFGNTRSGFTQTCHNLFVTSPANIQAIQIGREQLNQVMRLLSDN